MVSDDVSFWCVGVGSFLHFGYTELQIGKLYLSCGSIGHLVVSEMTKWMGLSLIPRTHMVKGEDQLLQIVQ